MKRKKLCMNLILHVAATCVRLPVFTSHSESVYIETKEKDVTVDEFKEVIARMEKESF